MTYAFTYEVPGNEQIYSLVTKTIGNVCPEGLITAVVTRTETGVRHVDVWQSREQWVAFRDGHVRPAVAVVLADLGIPAPAEPPEEQELELIDVMT